MDGRGRFNINIIIIIIIDYLGRSGQRMDFGLGRTTVWIIWVWLVGLHHIDS